MKKNKILPFIITLVILIIVILLGGFAYAYFFTDAFKSDKQLFIKYISQNAELVKSLEDEDLEKYKEKQKNTPYTNNGEIKMYFTLSELQETAELNALKDASITFNGSSDKANKYGYQNIKLNYSDTENVNLEYIHNQDNYGIKINNILNKYIAVENNNLKDWAQKLELDEEIISTIPDKIDFENNIFADLFTEEEIKNLQKKYLKILLDISTDDMFSKAETAENTVYTITITESKVEEFVKEFLKTLKDDELIMSKIKKVMIESMNISEEDANTYIQEFKDEIQKMLDEDSSVSNYTDTTESSYSIDNYDDGYDTEYDIENQESIFDDSEEASNLIINVYVKSSELQKTEFVIDNNKMSISKIADGLSLEYLEEDSQTPQVVTVEKTKGTDELIYNVKLTLEGEEQLAAKLSFKGINTLNSVEESYEYTISSNLIELAGNIQSYEYAESFQNNSNIENEQAKINNTYKNTKTFTTNLTKQNITTEDMIFLNGHSLESIENLMGQVMERFEQVNTNQMKAIGISEEENPMKYYLPASIPVLAMAFGNSTSFDETSIFIAVPVVSLGILTYNQATDIIYDTSLPEVEAQTFDAENIY